MITADQSICSIITSSRYKQRNYPQYFYPEFKAFLNESYKSDDPEFEQKRKIGENDQQICKIIRDDDVDSFISFIKEHETPLTSCIEDSIYETNSLLLKGREISLINYSVFNGSIKVFNYLKSNLVELTPSLWFYGAHGQNLDIFQILENQKIDTIWKFGYFYSNDFYRMFLKNQNSNIYDSIEQTIKKIDKDIIRFTKCIKNYNYVKLDEIITNDPNILDKILNDDYKEFKLFYALCKYDYIVMVDFFLENLNEKVMSLIIQK